MMENFFCKFIFLPSFVFYLWGTLVLLFHFGIKFSIVDEEALIFSLIKLFYIFWIFSLGIYLKEIRKEKNYFLMALFLIFCCAYLLEEIYSSSLFKLLMLSSAIFLVFRVSITLDKINEELSGTEKDLIYKTIIVFFYPLTISKIKKTIKTWKIRKQS